MNKDFIKKLKSLLGEERVLDDPDILEVYSRDETSNMSAMPELIIRARDAGDVCAVMKFASEHKIPVTPRGAGTGVTGGALPVGGGIVLSLEKMNRILEIDGRNMIAVVEPGAITGDIQKAAMEHGLMYPPDPASLENCSIGGNVAENAGGPHALKYGTTKDYVTGLEFVTADGELIKTGGKMVKNVTGYGLAGIIIGSEGTLCVITKIYLRLIPAPLFVKDTLLPFDSMQEAVDAVHSILSARIIPAALEFMESDAIRLVERHTDIKIPFPEAAAHLLIQLDGESEDALYAQIEKICAAAGVSGDTVIIAETPAQKERLWKTRRSIRDSIHAESPVFLAEDCSVPKSHIASFLKDLKDYFKSKGLSSIMFGHAGDGNVHIDILKGPMDIKNWLSMLTDLKSGIYSIAIRHEGTITGEHGIGALRKNFLPMAASPAEIELYRRIKNAFDPQGIINPGKIIPDNE